MSGTVKHRLELDFSIIFALIGVSLANYLDPLE